MEDDDEFGDIYSDVLQPFSSSLSSSQVPLQPPSAASNQRPIDLKLRNDDDDDDIRRSSSFPTPPSTSDKSVVNSLHNSISADNGLVSGASRVSPSTDAKSGSTAADFSDAAVFQSIKEEKDLDFDIEDGNTGAVEESGPMIPGLSFEADDSKKNEIDASGSLGVAQEDDWEEDSDSDDELRIVLNDNNHGPMGMERGMMGDGDDDDEDDDPLVIVADGDAGQPMEEQDWGMGEDAAAEAGAEGERKEGGEAVVKGNAMAVPKIGYSNHGYHHPFHSQFKYVRPGAQPIPGATSVGPGAVPGQIRPPTNMVPVAGRGRGDWRHVGMKNTQPMQKGYHAGFGMPPWGNNNVGRGFGGGLEFTLPSHKTIFEVDIDSFEEKPWKHPGVDVSDFFNFGLNEESWKNYCKQLEQHRLEATMQSKIRVYESGRAEQDYDPDLPPELAAAVGLHDIAADNSNVAKSDVGQSDLTKGSAHLRPPLPTGRAIQVEGGYGERLPSIDTRPPRLRDSDAIIEIVLQDSGDDDSSAGNGDLDGDKYNPPRDDLRGSCVPEDYAAHIDTEYYDDFPQGYDGQKAVCSQHEAPSQYRVGSRDEAAVESGDYGSSDEERPSQGRKLARSRHSTPSEGDPNKAPLDNVEQESGQSIDDKPSPVFSSPASVRDTGDHSDGEPLLAEANSGERKDEMTEINNNKDETPAAAEHEGKQHFAKKNKVVSNPEHPLLQETDDREDSKARSGSSKEYQKWQDGVEEEVLQERGARNTGNCRRGIKDRDERNPMAGKGRESSYPLRDMDMRNEGNSRKGRTEDTRKSERGDRSNIRERERSEREEFVHSRKQQLENGGYRVLYDKDLSSRHREREDIVDDYPSKRRKDDPYLRRDKEEAFYSHKEFTSNRRRERDSLDDYSAVRHKDDFWHQRERGDRKREREELYKAKQSHEESVPKREKDEGRGSLRRGPDDKAWVGHGRLKDEPRVSDKDVQMKDSVRNSKQRNRREEESYSHHRGRDDVHVRGSQGNKEERKSRQERSTALGDRAIDGPDNLRMHEKKHKDNTRKNKESEGRDHGASVPSRRNPEDQSGQSDAMGSKNAAEQQNGADNKRHKEYAYSDDEHQDSKRGRSKLERWTSHKERDFTISSKSSASLKLKDIDAKNNTSSSELSKLPYEKNPGRPQTDEKPSTAEERGDPTCTESKDGDAKPPDDRHLDTVEKLKKRSERFKLPMSSEKDAVAVKKLENEPLPSVKTGNAVESDIKPERPARKRRWISS